MTLASKREVAQYTQPLKDFWINWLNLWLKSNKKKIKILWMNDFYHEVFYKLKTDETCNLTLNFWSKKLRFEWISWKSLKKESFFEIPGTFKFFNLWLGRSKFGDFVIALLFGFNLFHVFKVKAEKETFTWLMLNFDRISNSRAWTNPILILSFFCFSNVKEWFFSPTEFFLDLIGDGWCLLTLVFVCTNVSVFRLSFQINCLSFRL